MPPTNDPAHVVNDVWATSKLTETSFITLPSGQTCKAKPIGLQGIMEAGLIGEADSLTAYVGKEYLRKVRGAKGKPDGEEVDVQKLMKSPDALKKIVMLVDKVTPMVVTEPVVLRHFEDIEVDGKSDTRMIPPEERLCRCGMREDSNEHHDHNGHTFNSAIYTDMIQIEDKMFLFNFALAGVKDAESFREESAAALGVVADGQDVPGHTQSSASPGRRSRPKRRRGPS